MELNYKNLEKIIKQLGHQVYYQKETDPLVLTFKKDLIEYPVFIRTIQQQTIVQIVLFLPCKAEEKTLADTLRSSIFSIKSWTFRVFAMTRVPNSYFTEW